MPVRTADWEEREGRIVVVRPKPAGRGPRFWLDWIAYVLAPKRLRLDDVGSFCWRRMDGGRTAGEIASLLRGEFGDAFEPAEERLGRFLQMLRREEIVRFPELDSMGGSP